MMLTTNDPEFSARYPHGAIVRDRWGRQIPGVIACNPETGEVIRADGTWLAGQWLRLISRVRIAVVTRHVFRWASLSGGILYRHGFWPAPLLVVPKPIWNGDPEQYAPVPRRSAAEREQLL